MEKDRLTQHRLIKQVQAMLQPGQLVIAVHPSKVKEFGNSVTISNSGILTDGKFPIFDEDPDNAVKDFLANMEEFIKDKAKIAFRTPIIVELDPEGFGIAIYCRMFAEIPK